MPVLRIKSPHSTDIVHVLSEERISIGRQPDNTIQILDRSVSAHHAELLAVDGHYRLHDLRSTNLSFVDGEPVSDFHLRRACVVAFGTVECEFDPDASESSEPRPLTPAQLEKDVAYLRGENSELLGKLAILQRRIDILSSARLVTGRTDNAPASMNADSLKAIARERNEMRHLNEGLKLELDQVREELVLTIRERDTARRERDILKTERVSIGGAVQKKTTQRLRTSFAEENANAQNHAIVAPPGFENLPPLLRTLRATLDEMPTHAEAGDGLCACSQLAFEIVTQLLPLGTPPIVRVAQGVDDLLRDLRDQSQPVAPAILRTLSQAVDLLGILLDPGLFQRGSGLEGVQILAIDDDVELLATVCASLQLAQIEVEGCGTAEDALNIINSRKFDLVLADICLPGMDGVTFCTQARELAEYRKTPIVFLTVSDTLEQRAETSLNGGTDFIGKPFNILDLALKVQTWAVKNQLGLL